MVFNVAQLLQQPIGAARRYTIEDEGAITDPDLDLIGAIQGHVRLMRTQRGLLVSAALKGRVRQPCVRCLSDTSVDLEIEIEEEFVPSIDLRTGAHLTYGPDDEIEDAQIIDAKHALDLREVVRQELLLALPAHLLCSDKCAGICPTCGANLNEETCDCLSEDVDPRWAALADLKTSIAGE